MISTMRADQYLTTHGHYDSRARAQAAIKAGLVSVDGKVIKKPSEKIKDGATVQAGREHPWVSRGGIKLDHALRLFDVNPAGMTCLDVGASTGGFSQVLWSITARQKSMPWMLVMDSYMRSYKASPRLFLWRGKTRVPIVCDASFISAMKVLENPLRLAAPKAGLITLVKPQFEVGKVNIGRGGLVKSEELGLRALDTVRHWVREQGWTVQDSCPSPIKGGSGNREYLLFATRN